MPKITELLAQQISSAQANVSTWGTMIINIRTQGATGNGSDDDTNAFLSAIDMLKNTGGEIWLPPGTYRIGQNADVPSNITIVFIAGSKISVDSGKTLSAVVVAEPLSRIFSGLGEIVLKPILTIYPHWFGASGSTRTISGTIGSGENTLTVSTVGDFDEGQGIAMLTQAGMPEIVTLTITGGASAKGYFKIYLNDTYNYVPVDAGMTPAQIGDVIRALNIFNGWTRSGSDETVVFTSRANGPTIAAAVFEADGVGASGTGVEATITTTQTGVADTYFRSEITKITGNKMTLKDAPLAALTNVTVYHDDSFSLQKAFDAGMKMDNAQVCIPYTDMSYPIFNGLSFDASKVSVQGALSVIDASRLMSGHALKVYGTSDYAHRYRVYRKALSGITLIGGVSNAPIMPDGLFLGDEVSTYPNGTNNFQIENVVIQGFHNNIRWGHNAWRIYFKNCASMWGRFAVKNADNIGENNVFEGCAFYDSGAHVEVYTGTFFFQHCSFDNVSVKALGDMSLHFDGCHFENPGSSNPGYRYIDVQAINATVFLQNSDIILNGVSGGVNGGDFNRALFYVRDDCDWKGLHINNLRLFQNPHYQPWQCDDGAYLVAGTGRVTFKGGFTSWYNAHGFVVSKALNRCYNGYAERGDFKGWKISTNSTSPSAYAIDTVDFKNGTGSFKLSCAAWGKYVEMWQDFEVEASQWFTIQLWRKCEIDPAAGSIGTGAARAYVKIEFFSRYTDYSADYQTGGTDPDQSFIFSISERYSENISSSDGWALKQMDIIVPPGADFARLSLGVNSGQLEDSGGSYAWYDDVVVNLI